MKEETQDAGGCHEPEEEVHNPFWRHMSCFVSLLTLISWYSCCNSTSVHCCCIKMRRQNFGLSRNFFLSSLLDGGILYSPRFLGSSLKEITHSNNPRRVWVGGGFFVGLFHHLLLQQLVFQILIIITTTQGST